MPAIPAPDAHAGFGKLGDPRIDASVSRCGDISQP
jgi:hypothetical protein